MLLNYAEIGSGRPVIILHGLFGSGANWRRIARGLADEHRLILPDLRNHGESFHSETMSYADMANDVMSLIHALHLSDVVLLGHSMGGKVVMTMVLSKLTEPTIAGCIIADIAPVTYDHNFSTILNAVRSLPLDQINSRKQAESLLLNKINQPGLVNFISQNLVRKENGFFWRINLDTIENYILEILQFPSELGQHQCRLPSLFISGSESPYMRPSYSEQIFHHFPVAELVMLKDAGHWLHAEKPEEFTNNVRRFIRYINLPAKSLE